MRPRGHRHAPIGRDTTGPGLMVSILVVGFPLVFMVSGALVAVILGHVLWRDGGSGSRETNAWS